MIYVRWRRRARKYFPPRNAIKFQILLNHFKSEKSISGGRGLKWWRKNPKIIFWVIILLRFPCDKNGSLSQIKMEGIKREIESVIILQFKHLLFYKFNEEIFCLQVVLLIHHGVIFIYNNGITYHIIGTISIVSTLVKSHVPKLFCQQNSSRAFHALFQLRFNFFEF